jgi:hypothetical protein
MLESLILEIMMLQQRQIESLMVVPRLIDYEPPLGISQNLNGTPSWAFLPFATQQGEQQLMSGLQGINVTSLGILTPS